MSSPNSDTKASKRFNLKLPPTIRQMFHEPFDAYLGYLLENTLDLKEIDINLEHRLKGFTSYPSTASSARWTLWVSREIRQLFDQQKSNLAPLRTHGAFVELLLAYRNYLESIGSLPKFVASRRHYGQERAPTIPSNTYVADHGLPPFQPMIPYQYGMYAYPQNLTINTDPAFLATMGSTPRFINRQESVSSSDSYSNLFHSDPPSMRNFDYASRDTLFAANPAPTLQHIPRAATESSLFNTRSRDEYDTFSKSKKSRYTYAKPPMPTSYSDSQFSTTVGSSLGAELDEFSLLLSPDPNLTMYQSEKPSFDIIKATQLQDRPRIKKEDTVVDNDLSHYFNFETIHA